MQGQVQAYYMENKKYPATLGALEGDYVNEGFEFKCPNGKVLSIDENGNVH
ncbi:hypothetical protein [Lederbergia citri]|uniref:Uncharacterized protein n=1 Tax=Lederbergia citri TaxID=2833580 RepID=A0A942TDV7_9BACI|nr:hypothetical protein [Lederbergia citri]MBS4194649.1 hypothetical protein [Lederbergia citri]